MNEERIWLLLSLRLSNEATAAELAELDRLLQQHPELGEKARVIGNLWQADSSAGKPDAIPASFNRHLQRLSNEMAGNATLDTADTAKLVAIQSSYKKWVWAAACAVVLLVVAYQFLFTGSNTTKPARMAENTVSTKAGSKSKIQLPDGTQVWLNADSKIEYNENFNVKLREIKLTGEAFFDVVKNKEKPFIIHTAQMDVKVVGTAFNVRSYPDEPTTETALLRGAVEISLRNNPEKKYFLKPNDKLVINNNVTVVPDSTAAQPDAEKQLVKMKKVNISKSENEVTETMWVKNKLAFDNETLEKILAETERWYNVQIELKNDNAKLFRFTSVFENKPLTDVLEALCLAAHLRYQVKGSEVTIW